MYIVWHFIDDIAQLNGVFDNEEDAQNACEIWDCYHFIEKNKSYNESINSTDVAYYKVPSGKFKTFAEIFKEENG